MLPPGQAQHPILGSPRAEQECPPVPLLPASCARKCTIWAREQVEMGQSRSSGSALGMRGLGSHSPTSSDDCQGQSNAEAPSPQESLLGPAWGERGAGDRETRSLGSSQGVLAQRESHPLSLLHSPAQSIVCNYLLSTYCVPSKLQDE